MLWNEILSKLDEHYNIDRQLRVEDIFLAYLCGVLCYLCSHVRSMRRQV